MSDGEEVVPTHHDRIRVLRHTERPAHPEGWLRALETCVATGDVGGAVSLLKCLAPTCIPSRALTAAAEAVAEERPAPRVA